MALKLYPKLSGWLSVAALCVVGAQAQAETLLERAVERGSLNICTGDEYPPFKFIDKQGHNNGLIYDLILDLQKRLSQTTGKDLTLNIVQVTPINRTLFLNQGRCEFLVTSLLDTPARHREVDFVSPGYYSSAATVFAAKTTPLTSWEGLRGKTLCAPPTSVWVRPYEERYGVSFASFNGLAEIRQALIDGRCVGALGDDVLYRGLAKEPGWQDFEVKLPSQDAAPWGIALRKGQDQLLQTLSGIVRDWHASGLIIELEKKYNIEPNSWVARQHESLSAQNSIQGPDTND
jgi:polar amino acid transport system substrate-binding protein